MNPEDPTNPETRTLLTAVEEHSQRLKRLRQAKGELTKEQILDCLDLFSLNLSALSWYQQALLEASVDRVNWNAIFDKVNAL